MLADAVKNITMVWLLGRSSHERSYSTLSPVSTGMGDRLRYAAANQVNSSLNPPGSSAGAKLLIAIKMHTKIYRFERNISIILRGQLNTNTPP